MNKTIIININGIIFHIEEDAYETLQTYMVEVKKHFGFSADSQEIVSDIESRIAEMFSERINEQKAVITMQDVKEVCAQMGEVKDFELDEDTAQDSGPSSSSFYEEERTLFRDPDDKVLGGVCSGLAHYFGFETVWVRLVLLLLAIFAGSGILIYIVLWIVVPKAKTRADKMRMRGEPANLQNFKRSFQEEMEDVKKNFTAAGEKISSAGSRVSSDFNNSNGINSFMDVIGKILIVFVKIIGIFLIFGISLALIALIIALFIGSGHLVGDIFYNGLPIQFVDSSYQTAMLTAGFIVIAIPLFVILFLALRVLFNRKVMGPFLGFSMLIIWLVAVVFSIVYISKTALDFKEEVTITQEINLVPQSNYTLNIRDINTLMLNNQERLDSANGFLGVKRTIRRNNNDFFDELNEVTLRIEKGQANQAPQLIEEFTASGKNFQIAGERAGRISYEIKQEGNNIWFASRSTLPNGEIIRNQHVEVKLYLPVGTRVLIPKNFEREINIRNISVLDCANEDDQEQVLTEWIMTDLGLKCVNNLEKVFPNSIPIDTTKIDSVYN